MSNASPTSAGYGSADDLPSIVELRQQLAGFKLLTRFVARDQRAQALALEAQLNEHVQLVDDFYRVLGPRYWVFPDHFDVTDLKALVVLEPVEAEQRLIALYTPETLRRVILRFHAHSEMRPRLDNVRLAIDDYEAGRYYATVLMLLTVMDGFVNDVNRAQRRGLHARDADEMVAWDSVVGHHMGLSHTHTMFTKPTTKTTTDELHDVQRHGIVHGMQLNYNNPIVATKAWNQLFAVGDWATSLRRKAVPHEPKPGWRDVVKDLTRLSEEKKALAAFRPFSLDLADADFDVHPAIEASAVFLDAWKRKNYGEMAGLLSHLVARDSLGKTAGFVRQEYSDQVLDSYELLRVEHRALAACEVFATLTINGHAKSGQLRWVQEGPDGKVGTTSGHWKLIVWGPSAIVTRAE